MVKTLAKFEDLLTDKGFLRIHDSHIINIKYIVGYLKGKPGLLVMTDDSRVPISTRRQPLLGKIIKNKLQ